MSSNIFYGFWDYWELRHKVTFDGINKLILINDGVTNIDAQADIYSDWKEWTSIQENIKFLPALNTVGGDPTIEGQRLDVTYFLINGWKIKPYPGSYDLSIIGNLFDVDGESIKVDADVDSRFPNNISINTNTSVIVRQVDTTGGTGIDPDAIFNADLIDSQETALYNIEDRVISIESILQSPITASLEDTQAAALLDIQLKLAEIHQLHGLDDAHPLTVTQTSRTFGEITQVINTTGEDTTQETIITRV